MENKANYHCSKTEVFRRSEIPEFVPVIAKILGRLPMIQLIPYAKNEFDENKSLEATFAKKDKLKKHFMQREIKNIQVKENRSKTISILSRIEKKIDETSATD